MRHPKFTPATWRQRWLRSGLCLLLCLVCHCPALAHDPGLSNVELRLASGQLIVFLAFNRSVIEPLVTIDANRDGNYTPEEFNAARAQLETLALEMFEITANGQRLTPLAAKAELDTGNDVLFYVAFAGDTALPIK